MKRLLILAFFIMPLSFSATPPPPPPPNICLETMALEVQIAVNWYLQHQITQPVYTQLLQFASQRYLICMASNPAL